MRQSLVGGVFAVALLLGPSACVHGGAERREAMGEGTGGGGLEEPGTGGAGAQAVQEGFTQGVVRDIDLRAGRLTLSTERGALTLQGTPGQLAPLQPGRQVSLGFTVYAGQPWVNPGLDAPGIDTLAPESTAHAASVSGVVTGVHKEVGQVMVNTAGGQSLTFRAHPAAVLGLAPGQVVRVTYQRVGSANWASRIQVQGATGAAG
jgi:hypothetical protein